MAEEERTRRWQRLERPPSEIDPLRLLRAAIAAVRKDPADDELRRRLRALAAEQGSWEQLALLLDDEARSATTPVVAAALYEELADVHENLDQPVETIAAMEEVVARQPDEVRHHDRLAWLYRRAGATIKAAQAFEQVAALARDDRARAALRAAGRLYRDAGKLELAAATYRKVVERRATDLEAWRALDDLLGELGRWREVAEARGVLAEHATGVDKAVWLRAQARAWEQAGEPQLAASLVALAAQYAPEDVSGLVDYATVLARDGKTREAASVLAERIQEGVADGAPSAELAALRMRLIEMLEVSGDHAGARKVLDQLLAAAPDFTPARSKLVEVARRARAAGDLRDALALYEQAVELENLATSTGEHAAPASRDSFDLAIDRAINRVLDPNELDELAHTDQHVRLDATDEVTDAAPDNAVQRELDAVRTDLAVERATAEAAAGDSAGAERALRAILLVQPLHLAANLALVDLLSATGRLHAASHHLRGTLAAAPERTAPEILARLVLRCARITQALGDADEAHQLLHEAHHLARRDLEITLALGESCFQRKLWRETAIHLGALAEHPEAPAHASRVALALVRAGQAEVRALKPANAAKHYEAAVRLDPACGAAWHQLAELARDRGDLVRAAECLEHEAAATTETLARVRLYDALGDLALEKLDDPARAERAWGAAGVANHPDVLRKLLAVQRQRGATSERADTCERLAALAPDPGAALPLLVEAAHAASEAGDPTRARTLADRLATTYPLDAEAIACASQIATEDHDAVAGWLRRALGAWDAAGDRGDGDVRRADLWRRLGDAERHRKNERAGLEAYQRAVVCAPDSEGARAARRGLIELAASFGRRADTSRLALVEAEQEPDDVVASARALATRGTPDAIDDARQLYQLARALDVRLDARDEQFLAQHPARAMASDEAYAAALAEPDRHTLVDDDGDSPLGELLAIVAEAMPLVCFDARAALDAADLDEARRLGAASDAATVALYPQIANALGGPATLLYAAPSHARSAPDLQLIAAVPPVIVLGPRLASVRARSRSDLAVARVDGDVEIDVDAELRFRLGRLVELARPHRVLAAGVARPAFERFVAGLVHSFGSVLPRDAREIPHDVTLEGERLRKALPVVLRQRLVERLAALTHESLDPSAYLAACERAADRAGLVACGHPGIAIHLAGGPERARHLVELAASQRYLAAQRTLRRRGP